jgi:hypothetical protein
VTCPLSNLCWLCLITHFLSLRLLTYVGGRATSDQRRNLGKAPQMSIQGRERESRARAWIQGLLSMRGLKTQPPVDQAQHFPTGGGGVSGDPIDTSAKTSGVLGASQRVKSETTALCKVPRGLDRVADSHASASERGQRQRMSALTRRLRRSCSSCP